LSLHSSSHTFSGRFLVIAQVFEKVELAQWASGVFLR
jgi:hypothetical protein